MEQSRKRLLIGALALAQAALIGGMLWLWNSGALSPAAAGDSAPVNAEGAAEDEWGSDDETDPRPQKLATSEVRINGRKITVELAVSHRERQKGLMFRKSLPKDRGMLFFFAGENDDTRFWNKNVPIDLDLAFADKTGLIRHIGHMKARSEKTSGTKLPVMYVLEMPGGYFAENKIKVGDRIELAENIRNRRGE